MNQPCRQWFTPIQLSLESFFQVILQHSSLCFDFSHTNLCDSIRPRRAQHKHMTHVTVCAHVSPPALSRVTTKKVSFFPTVPRRTARFVGIFVTCVNTAYLLHFSELLHVLARCPTIFCRCVLSVVMVSSWRFSAMVPVEVNRNHQMEYYGASSGDCISCGRRRPLCVRTCTRWRRRPSSTFFLLRSDELIFPPVLEWETLEPDHRFQTNLKPRVLDNLTHGSFRFDFGSDLLQLLSCTLCYFVAQCVCYFVFGSLVQPRSVSVFACFT